MSAGEIKHEQCEFGVFSRQAHWVEDDGKTTPFAMPLCSYRLGPAPPAAVRAWSGAIDFDRDCAVCPVYKPIP